MASVSRLCPEMSRMSRNPGHTWTFVDMIGQIWTKDLGHVQDMSRDVHHVLVLWIDVDIPGRIWTSLYWTNLDKLGNIRACPVVSRFVQCGCVQFKLATAATPARRARPAQRNLYQRLSLYMYPFYSRRLLQVVRDKDILLLNKLILFYLVFTMLASHSRVIRRLCVRSKDRSVYGQDR